MQLQFYEPSLLEPMVRAFHDLDRHYFGPAAADEATIRHNLLNNVLGADSGVRLVVAMDGQAVAGFASVSLLYPAPQQRPQLFMKDLYVCEAWRSRGVGERLMRFLARYALERGCVRFDWTTETNNRGAMAFYERLGATTVPEKVYYRLTGDAIAALADGRPTRPRPS